MSEVYVVVAIAGEHSDRSEWIAGVFLSKEEATEVAEEELRKSLEHPSHDRTWSALMDSYTIVEVSLNQWGGYKTVHEDLRFAGEWK